MGTDVGSFLPWILLEENGSQAQHERVCRKNAFRKIPEEMRGSITA